MNDEKYEVRELTRDELWVLLVSWAIAQQNK